MRIIKPSTRVLNNPDGQKILKEIEKAGRLCYLAEARITKDSAPEFVKGLIRLGHHSVLEHVSISVKITCDRGISHELVRHRLCSFSQESTRYCRYMGEVTFIKPFFWDDYFIRYKLWEKAMISAEKSYMALLEAGADPGQARSVLPNSMKTELVMTCNLREWRHIFALRCSAKAHPQMRELMVPLRADMRKLIPVIFEDNEE